MSTPSQVLVQGGWAKSKHQSGPIESIEIMCHYPPGTSKWNKIEHWPGKPYFVKSINFGYRGGNKLMFYALPVWNGGPK
jgi:hypothetical protein